jgi:hypothetical protein
MVMKKNIVQNVSHSIATFFKDIFVKNWGIKIISIVMTFLLWFLAHLSKL